MQSPNGYKQFRSTFIQSEKTRSNGEGEISVSFDIRFAIVREQRTHNFMKERFAVWREGHSVSCMT